ncbi:hypothetical protein DRN84_01425 [Candidatus Geothermarchaeota archaeon]|nr:MAG: hypothetical protein DRN84_01425 [Candidatus Geothermarchaeota archaeon]
MSSDYKDLFIETENLVFGRVSFLHMKIPFNWRVHPIPHRTDVETWIDKGDIKWVTSGYTGFILVDEDTGYTQPFYINVRRNISGKDLREILYRDLRNIDSIHEFKAGDFNALYYVKTKRRRRYILFGSVYEEEVIRIAIDCRDTYRVLVIEAPIKIGLKHFLNNILPLFKSIKC